MIGVIIQHNATLPIGFVRSLLDVKEPVYFEEGPYLHLNRARLFEKARILNEDLIYIDADIVFTKEDLLKIKEHLKTLDIVSGVYALSYPNKPAAIFDKSLKMIKPEKGVFEIGACGMGFIGISKRVVTNLVNPFALVHDKRTNRDNEEDISFCVNAWANGYKIWCDSSIKVGHIRTEVKYYEDTQ